MSIRTVRKGPPDCLPIPAASTSARSSFNYHSVMTLKNIKKQTPQSLCLIRTKRGTNRTFAPSHTTGSINSSFYLILKQACKLDCRFSRSIMVTPIYTSGI